MQNYDAIIIGSGAGGLTTALCLARAGKKVLVLEQHYVPGGWCHSFTLGGQRFSPGVHYIGLCEEGQSTSELYKGLGIANDIVLFRMNPKAFEHCIIDGVKYEIPAGLDNMASAVGSYFPSEAKGISKYIRLVKKVNYQMMLMPRLRGFWQLATSPFRTATFVHHMPFSLNTIISRYVKDPLAKAVLNVQCGDHGLPPKKANFVVHTAVMGHYAEGGFYPMGGGSGIVKAMTNAIKKLDGKVKVESSVKKILITNRTATGVELENGEQIFADIIISNADPGITYLELCGRENLSAKLQKRLDATKYSCTSLILFLTLDMDVTKFGIDSGNMWIFRDEDTDRQFEDLTTTDVTEGEEFPGLFMSCTTLKDPVSFNGRYHNFEIVTYVDYNCVSQFSGEKDYQTEEYKSFKDKVIAKFMNTVEKHIPGAKQHIVQIELGTPKTNRFYINSTRGNVYGTEKSLRNVGPMAFRKKSEIKNLYLCGASTLSHGVAGASYSGLETAKVILGLPEDEILKYSDGQELRVFDADNPVSWPDWVHAKRSDKVRHFKELKLNTEEAGI